MAGSSGSAAQKRNKNKMMAGELKRKGEERTRGRCAVCYREIPVDGPKSRYVHKCKIGNE